jgi:hypothetical protein
MHQMIDARRKLVEPLLAILAVFMSVALLLGGCSEGQRDEISRIAAPGGNVEAVLMKKQSHATASTPYELFLVQKDSRVGGDALLLADQVDNIRLVWRSPKLLEIQYKTARIFHFRNFWSPSDGQASSTIIEIRLRPDSSDFALGTP